MAALAYLLPPLSGLFAYLKGSSERTRFHGLQAVAFGLVWPALLYLGATMSAGVTQGIFALGVATWLFLLVGTALGHDPRLPGGGTLRRLGRVPPR